MNLFEYWRVGKNKNFKNNDRIIVPAKNRLKNTLKHTKQKEGRKKVKRRSKLNATLQISPSSIIRVEFK